MVQVSADTGSPEPNLQDTFAEVDSSPSGLSSQQAADRLSRFGPNEITDHQPNPLLTFLGYFWAPIPWMIEIALVLSLIVQHWPEAIVIAILLAMNGLVSFVEEHQAAGAIAALKQRLAGTTSVLRDGNWTVLPVRELVPGDVVRLRLGDVIPADARLIDDVTLEVDQSALTGESLPVEHTKAALLYSGSVVVRGEGDALVFATAGKSYFGSTAKLVETAGTVSHFQQAVLRIGHYLIVAALVLVTLTVVVSLARGNPALETVQFALVVTIASIPVALPAVLSVTMAVGARNLARSHAVVSHLPAIEELGGMDVLCCDKTGTLTQNALSVTDVWTVDGVDRDTLLSATALASRAEDRDPIDAAVLAVAEAPADMRVLSFSPFDPTRKRTEAVVVDEAGNRFKVTKGAPQVIARLAVDDAAAAQASAAAERFAGTGQRALGLARADGDGGWRMLGVLALADPPRADSAQTVAAARELGVSVKMVTGDQVAIGRQVGQAVGIGDRIMAAEELGAKGEKVTPALIGSVDGFAQVFPEHKFAIVKSLQADGHIVGMTGDGVNDAPALKQADAGIAVAGATDAARAAADVVLLAPGLSVIVEAIRQARQIFARMTNYATYRIAETIRVLLLIVISIVALNFFPVTAIMIVLLAVLNDGAILAIAYDRVRGAASPAAWDMRRVIALAGTLGLLGVVETFILLAIARAGLHLDDETLRTLIYLKLSVSGHLTVFVTRTNGPFWSRPAPSPVLLTAVIGTQLVATLIAVYGLLVQPIGWGLAGLVWAYSLLWFLVEDRVKLVSLRVLSRPNQAPAQLIGTP
ncbi:plasma-membrane proton-efflux P-type ATPase [Mycolicibacterium conceptionense]|uniref:Metal-transporting ATPase n=1 Tax=Mycolicibacterium conceptionense TaxID=451644 RepID=A0ABX3V9W8_9MYCO|nr:plasma-membrane proton-efflux P-type ATPase [Mycolicibacterium conceptionense]OMB86235.1 plasma-membrane proton-efflux P-type ATPase [Mycolicibacterium conceptionense]OMB95240.1 plasma-membrane proton-efflux P-type ATPase [Mycolicibacterium conceptionense]ORV26974.1 metal-transporting ATPase [Mycolicibacterium conceptionense]